MADGKWYSKAEDWYVNNCPTTVDGVLGGFGHLDPLDVAESCTFLVEMFKLTGHKLREGTCLDCGAGIGRVTKNLLSKFFKTSDLLESNRRLLDASITFVDDAVRGDLYCDTLQNFIPAKGKIRLRLGAVGCYLSYRRGFRPIFEKVRREFETNWVYSCERECYESE